MSRKTRLYAPDATSSDWHPGRIAPFDPQQTFLLQENGSPTARPYIGCQDNQLFVSSPQRSMSTPVGAMWFAKSQRRRKHFKNQHALIVREKGCPRNQGVYGPSKG